MIFLLLKVIFIIFFKTNLLVLMCLAPFIVKIMIKVCKIIRSRKKINRKDGFSPVYGILGLFLFLSGNFFYRFFYRSIFIVFLFDRIPL